MIKKRFIVLIGLLLIVFFIWKIDFSKFSSDNFISNTKSILGSQEEGKIVYAYEPLIDGKLEARCMEIYIMNPDGSHKKRLTNNNFYDNMPKFSPNRKKIVFMSARKEIRGKGALSHQIYIMDSDGENERQLTFGDKNSRYPSWLPDGKRILFATQGGEGAAGKYYWCIMDSDGKDWQYLNIRNEENIYNLTYSPNGKKIAFSLRKDKRHASLSDIWMMNLDGAGKRNLFQGKIGSGNFAWSPNGEKIAFIEYIRKPWLKIINVNTGETENFVLKNGLRYLSFSPDGKWLIGSGFGALYKVNMETKKEECIIGMPRKGYKCPQYDWSDWR